MNARSHVEAMLRDFGHEVGTPLVFDDEGLCVLEVGDDVECLIAMPAQSDAVGFCVNVAPVIGEREAFFAHLLTLNFTDEATQGAALGLEESGSEVVARYTVPAERLQHGDFARIVTNLADLALQLRERLTAWQEERLRAAPAPSGAAEERAGAGPGRPLFPTDFA